MSPRKLAVALVAVLAVPAAPAAGAPLHGPTKLRLVECQAAVEQSERFAIFEGEMRALDGASRLQMRVTLQARTQERARWRKVTAPGFGTWISASPGVRRLVYTKRVENLFAPARYRVVAKYRWLDAAGAIVARDERRTPVCRQPDQRPDLAALRIGIEPGSGGDSRIYVIPLVNEGHGDAAGFAIRLIVNGQVQRLASLDGLAAAERSLLGIEAPACRPGTSIVAVLDAEGVIDEADEADNTITAPCPAGT